MRLSDIALALCNIGIWTKIFLVDSTASLPRWLVLLENAAVAPFVAALTFIGSMGNIPLATVLNSNGACHLPASWDSFIPI